MKDTLKELVMLPLQRPELFSKGQLTKVWFPPVLSPFHFIFWHESVLFLTQLRQARILIFMYLNVVAYVSAMQGNTAIRPSWYRENHACKSCGNRGRRKLHQYINVKHHFEGYFLTL